MKLNDIEYKHLWRQMMESTIPLFPCKALDETLAFYRALGFEVTYEQSEPYLYASVRRGEIEFHFSTLSVYGAKSSFGASLVFVQNAEQTLHAFADGLRAHYGRVLTAGVPRVTRMSKGIPRFRVFDPTGNMLIFLQPDEVDGQYQWSENQTALQAALANAEFLRDVYANDAAAAKSLDSALARHPDADPIDRALAWAARAELAVAMGDDEGVQRARAELGKIPLTAAQCQVYSAQLQAADHLAQWIG